LKRARYARESGVFQPKCQIALCGCVVAACSPVEEEIDVAALHRIEAVERVFVVS
jgi:hypothetical protein